MNYTESQKDLISSLIGTKIAPRTKSESLRQSLAAAHERMYGDALTASDLILLNSALELLIAPTPEDSSKEEYRAMIEALMVTRGMLREREAQDAGR